jgi:hypothetical protein
MMRRPVCLSGRRRAELRRHLCQTNKPASELLSLPSYCLARTPQLVTSSGSLPHGHGHSESLCHESARRTRHDHAPMW